MFRKTNKEARAVVGNIIVNLDSSASVEGIRRADKDAECAAAALLLYWLTVGDGHGAHADSLAECLADLVFSGRRLGGGSSFLIEVLKRSDLEDSQRNVLGASAARKCRHVMQLCSAIQVEDARKTTPETWAAVMKDKGCDSGWGAETVKRYAELGRRLVAPPLMAILETWEFYDGRNTVIDKITQLRVVMGACEDDEKAPTGGRGRCLGGLRGGGRVC
jgi:hypothetical protein